MGQIAEWLEKLGLEQYAKLFAENDIDVAVLPHLSELKKRRLRYVAVFLGCASNSRGPHVPDMVD